jgi:hypothetical protein
MCKIALPKIKGFSKKVKIVNFVFSELVSPDSSPVLFKVLKI